MKYKGYIVEAELPEECGHSGYSVSCVYKFIKKLNKYRLTMWLSHKDFDIDLYIGDQYVEATKEDINNKIEELIKNASLSGYFEKAIQKFEFTFKCFDKGYELLEHSDNA